MLPEHIQNEIEGIETALNELIEKKNYFESEKIQTADPEQKYSLQKKIEKLDIEIAEKREQLKQLHENPAEEYSSVIDKTKIISKSNWKWFILSFIISGILLITYFYSQNNTSQIPFYFYDVDDKEMYLDSVMIHDNDKIGIKTEQIDGHIRYFLSVSSLKDTTILFYVSMHPLYPKQVCYLELNSSDIQSLYLSQRK